MQLSFTKMHGCGNDYIYVNCFEHEIEAPEALAIHLSDRHTGIGGDGFVLILPSDIADANMRMFNADGSEGSMCGNAIRCVAKYLYDNGLVRKTQMRIETLSGVKRLELFIANEAVCSAKVNMGPAEIQPSQHVEIENNAYTLTCISMGNPHAVIFCEDVDALDLHALGPQFEHHPLFPDRVNTEFVKILGKNHLRMRVWERGSGETQACGTGACAASVAAVLNGCCDKNTDIVVQLLGGELTIHYTDEAVYMTGPCVTVFEGIVEL